MFILCVYVYAYLDTKILSGFYLNSFTILFNFIGNKTKNTID